MTRDSRDGLRAALNRIEKALDRHGSHNPGSICIECQDDILTRPWKTVVRDILNAERAALAASSPVTGSEEETDG